MPSKPIELAPEAAKSFVRDMKAFFKTKNQLKQDEIAARQCFALQQHVGDAARRMKEAAN